MRYSAQLRMVAAGVLAPAVWLTGAVATALTVIGPEPLTGLATLGVTAVLLTTNAYLFTALAIGLLAPR